MQDLGGPADEVPTNVSDFFEPAKYQIKSFVRRTKKQVNNRLKGCIKLVQHHPHPPPSPPPPWSDNFIPLTA
jgi:hypothetical protein